MDDVASIYQIQKTLSGNRPDFSTVCQIAFYLGLPANTLLHHPSLPEEPVLKGRDNRYPHEETPKDWNQYDEDMAPIIEKAAYDIYHGNTNDIGRPGRVSERIVYKSMGIPSHRLENMPKCHTILCRYKESYAQNWARRLAWAYRKAKNEKESGPVFWCDIREISGVKKKNADVILPLLGQYADKTDADAIKALITSANDTNVAENH